MRRGLTATTLVVLVLAACVGPRSYGTGAPASALGGSDGGVNPNALAPNDVLEVRVYQEADLSGVYRVTPAGEVDFPLCGKVKVAGATASEAADALTACLRNGFVRRPQVAVMVKEFNSKKVFVFGEVAKPGAFPYEEGMTILHAVSAAGGFNRTASKNSVNVTRTVDGQEFKIPVRADDIVVGREKNFPIQPGDIIFVPESFL
jgi:protein involved in polysaccharide export with SLBB domain